MGGGCDATLEKEGVLPTEEVSWWVCDNFNCVGRVLDVMVMDLVAWYVAGCVMLLLPEQVTIG